MTREELTAVLSSHSKWLSGLGGRCANLSDANLSGADLSRADLTCAYLSGANLSDANLTGANLSGADLPRADLTCAYLSRAYLSGANLSSADLSRADLSRADLTGAYLNCANLSRADLTCAYLSGANLSGADLTDATLPRFQIVPQVGGFHAFKKLQNGVIAQIYIPEDAARTSSLVGRKCRASHVVTLSLSNGKQGGNGLHDSMPYVVNESTICDVWNDDTRIECTGGIHFFMTREEAEAYDQ